MCCAGQVISHTNAGLKYGCCNNKVISLNTTTCCMNQEIDIPSAGLDDMQCCGQEIINKSSEICCVNKDDPFQYQKHARIRNIKCCQHRPYQTDGHKCIDNQLISYTQDLCQGKIINLTEQMCCLGKVCHFPKLSKQNIQQNNKETRCCYQTGYNTTSHKCCLSHRNVGIAIPNSDNLDCCNEGYIDVNEELCCEGVNFAKHEGIVCCGNVTIHGEQGCCGGIPYDRKTHKCCADFTPIELQEDCCDGAALKRNHLCCSQQQVNKSKSTDDTCCNTYDSDVHIVTYNSTEKVCGSQGLQTKHKYDTYCGIVPYNPNKAVCCNDRLSPFLDGVILGCCRDMAMGQKLFNVLSQTCCGGHVDNRPSNMTDCCKGEIYTKLDSNNMCLEKCGAYYYNKDESICCARQIYPIEHGEACCSAQPYWRSQQKCCDYKLYNSTLGSCCGSELFDRRTHKCCGGYEVTTRGNKGLTKCCRNKMVYQKGGRCKKNGLVKRRRNVTNLENMCKRKTWEDFNGIEVDACLKKLAMKCTVIKVQNRRKKKETRITLKCEKIRKDFVPSHSFDLEIRFKQTANQIVKCRKKLINNEVLILLNKQLLTSKRRSSNMKSLKYNLLMTENDDFRLVIYTEIAGNKVKSAATLSYCHRFNNILPDRNEEPWQGSI